MKSVSKTVAPLAMAFTFALSGAVMADTVAPATKSAETATTVPATDITKPVVHHHKHSGKTEEAVKKNEAPAVAEKPATTTSATSEKTTDKIITPSAEVSKKTETVKTK